MNSVDVMLREGSGYNAVRGVLRVLGYDSLLKTGRRTEKNLKAAYPRLESNPLDVPGKMRWLCKLVLHSHFLTENTMYYII